MGIVITYAPTSYNPLISLHILCYHLGLFLGVP